MHCFVPDQEEVSAFRGRFNPRELRLSHFAEGSREMQGLLPDLPDVRRMPKTPNPQTLAAGFMG
jgi:hypothetical protein